MTAAFAQLSDTHFKRVVDNLRDGVALEEDGVITYANPSLFEQLGHDSVVGKSMMSVLSEQLNTDSAKQLSIATRTAQASTGDVPTELRLTLSGRVENTYEVSIQNQHCANRCALVYSFRELPSVHGVRAALEHADRLASLGTLAAGVAHEINNPLAYVVSNLGYSIEQILRIRSMLRDAPASTETLSILDDNLAPIAEALEEAGEGTDRVARIVQGLKSFSRSEGESRGPVDLERVLNSAVSMAENEIRYRAQLVRSYGKTAAVFGNEARLVQVFVNLLVNAAQAIPEGNPHAHWIRIATRVGKNGNVITEVSDTGAGIPRDMLDRIFDPFFTTKPIGVGTGLGLSICHGLVHGLGGNISVVSEESQGTTFRVELLSAEPSKTHRSPTTERPSTTRGELLIIDDEPLVLRAFRRTLAAHHNILTVSDAKKALAMIENGQAFDLIFCDLMMPGMTGMDFHAVLRTADPALAERVVLLTGGAFTSSARDYLNSVPNRALEKPLHPRALRNFVSQALQ